jgi:membrane protease YdiL (CAAX protease family)
MENINKKFWSIVAIIICCLILGVFLVFSYIYQIRYQDFIFWPIMFAYIFLITYCLYKKEWRNTLGLSHEQITKNIKFKAFGAGLLLSIITNLLILITLINTDIPLSQPFGKDQTFIGILLSAIIIAPITEEILFRGFMQGVLQKNFSSNGNKFNDRIIIVMIAVLFSIAHVRYIVYTETVQWVLSLCGIFIVGIYLGYLRNKYQSVIPSIYAHFGYNIAFVVVAPILLIFLSVFQPNGWGKLTQKMNQMEFTNDSIYNFDRNNWDTLYASQRKFFAFHNPPRPELKQYIIKGRTAFVWVVYDIDTSGFISNFRVDSSNTKFETYTNNEIIENAAFRLVESFPQHKPLIKDGKKEASMGQAYVPIYY